MKYATVQNGGDDHAETDQQKVIAEQQATSPVSFLQALFPQDKQKLIRSASALSLYTAPSDQQIDDYTMDVVRAIRANDVAKLRDMLHNHGTSFEACNRNGEHLIHLACRRGDLTTVQFLIHEAQVSVNVVDDMGRSILHDVCWKSSPDTKLMDLLLTVVSPELLLAPDQRGHTPFDYARKEHWTIWNDYLRQRQDMITGNTCTTTTKSSSTTSAKFSRRASL
jgi:hypothetical protein